MYTANWNIHIASTIPNYMYITTDYMKKYVRDIGKINNALDIHLTWCKANQIIIALSDYTWKDTLDALDTIYGLCVPNMFKQTQ